MGRVINISKPIVTALLGLDNWWWWSPLTIERKEGMTRQEPRPYLACLKAKQRRDTNVHYITQSSNLMAAPVKVYGTPLSTAASRVFACLFEKDVEFQLIPINMAKGEHKKPDFLKLQPFGQVPAFQDESISLFESRAICRYICDKYADKGNRGLYGTNPLTKASIDQWLEAEGQNFNPSSGALVFQLAIGPRMRIPQDQGVIKQNEEKLGKVLDIYEKRLGESRFLAGDEFSLADLSHLPNAHYLVNATDRGEIITSRKNVGRWWGEISGRDSWKKVVEMQKSV